MIYGYPYHIGRRMRGERVPFDSSGWSFRKQLTVGTVSGAHPLFPAYVPASILGADFHASVKADGGDIRFVDEAGFEIPREVVSLDTGAQTGEMHSRVPALSTGASVYVYYGNAAATDYADADPFGAQAVWSNGYGAVWHCAQDPSVSQVLDSTANANHGTATGTMTTEDLVAGQVGTAIALDGVDDKIIIPHSSSLDPEDLTVQLWLHRNGAPDSNSNIITKGDTDTTDWSWLIDTDSTGLNMGFVVRGQSGNEDVAGNAPGEGVWTWLVCSYASTNREIVFTTDNSTTRSAILPSPHAVTTEDLAIGGNLVGTDENYPASYDEVRISSVVRSAAWQSAEFANQSSPATFWTVGPEEVL